MKRYPATAVAIAIILQGLVGPAATPAFALTAELAKKCRDMAIKAHPPALPGTSPYAQLEREFYQQCIANNGQMPEAPASAPPPTH